MRAQRHSIAAMQAQLEAFDQEGGRGLFLVHQLCDLVQLRSSPSGTTVRLFTWL